MKVIQFIDAFYPTIDGVVTVVDSYARYLLKNGERACVAAPNMEEPLPKGLPYRVYRYRSLEQNGFINYSVAIPGLDEGTHKKVMAEKPDLVHAHTPFLLGNEAYKISKAMNIPLVGSFHSKYYDDILAVTKSKYAAKLGVQYIVNFYNKCDSVWTVNETTAQTLRDYGYKGDIVIMENGIATAYDEERASLQRTQTRARLNIGENERVFVFVGQQNWKKNLRLIINGFAQYVRKYPDSRLVMVGAGPDSKGISGLTEELGIADRVIFTGLVSNKEELSGIYAASDLLLFPSLYDNASLVVREAADMHLPSVLIEGSNTAEGIEHGVNGYLCQNDTDSFVACIEMAMSDDKAREEVGKRASNTVCRRWDVIIQEVIGQYRQIIENSKNSL